MYFLEKNIGENKKSSTNLIILLNKIWKISSIW